LVLFRIVQEAITNTVRHAQATHVEVSLEISDELIRLVVTDDGQGFDVNVVMGGNERQCIGLLGMIERSTLVGGDCQIRSKQGLGTSVEVRIIRVANQ
jgi:two-component system sensor histidine kinase UhpB